MKTSEAWMMFLMILAIDECHIYLLQQSMWAN